MQPFKYHILILSIILSVFTLSTMAQTDNYAAGTYHSDDNNTDRNNKGIKASQVAQYETALNQVLIRLEIIEAKVKVQKETF
jgi:hypothetical protein